MKIIKPLLLYFSLAYFFSWIIFILLALNHHHLLFLFTDDEAHARVLDTWHAFGALGPTFAALITIKWCFGPELWNQFISGYALTNINFRAWLFALSPLFFFLIAILTNGIVTQHWIGPAELLRVNHIVTPIQFIAWFLPSLFYGFFEEPGWRGFALPMLQKKYNALAATTILTVCWVLWHVPSFFYRYEMNAMALVAFLTGIFSGAIFLTFLFNYTKGSILAVSIWHLTYDMVSMIWKEGMIPAIISMLIIVSAIVVLIRFKGKNLSPQERFTYLPS